MLVLITYATCHGSTRSIAERIGERLAGHGDDVEVVAAHKIQHVWQYGAVVAGSAIHDGDWLPEGAEFLHRHVGELADRPLWLFNVGMAPVGRRRFRRWFATHTQSPHTVAVERGFLNPHDVHYFAGVLERGHMPRRPRPFRWAFGGRVGDFRDWAEIDEWALGIAEKLAVE